MIENQDLRTRIVSIGIPILMASGNKLIRGSRMSIPADIPGRPDAAFDVTDEALNQWAHDGWVDLRPDNCARWQRRLEQILKEISLYDPQDTSSHISKGKPYWHQTEGSTPLHPPRLASWILSNEDLGTRMKS